MKKTHKGVTLIEVLVSIAVFAIISLALFSSVIAMKNVIHRQEEYAKIEMVCYDMNAYYHLAEKNNSPSSWYKLYFGYASEENEKKGYLSSEFKPTTQENAAYIVIFDENTIISITSIDKQIIYVENVKLGVNREDNG